MIDQLNQLLTHAPSAARLEKLYKKGLIPPEKKPFLVDLRRSSGPFLAVDSGDLICDGASQIASHGLGFNPGAFFGVAQYLESWINDSHGEDYLAVRSAFESLLQRKAGSDKFRMVLKASGAESVESALAHFYDRRREKKAHRVLAFEGSFHGRMMVALASTWNPTKREPFAWPGYESRFAPYPEMDSDDVCGPAIPGSWQAVWTTEPDVPLDAQAARGLAADDPLLRMEVESLLTVREHLASGEVFAILIEPMQCEGGDRYSSSRFHQGLAYLSETFKIPLLYDEIQTGFGLGGEFFWHRLFNLRSTTRGEFFPSAIICAKKSQTGLVLIHDPTDELLSAKRCRFEPVSVASVIRGYIQGSVIDQFRPVIDDLEQHTREHLANLGQRFPDQIRRLRCKGMAFAFDVESPEVIKTLVGKRFEHGLLYYPAGTHTARFRLSLGYRNGSLDLFWQQLDAALHDTFNASHDSSNQPGVDSGIRSPADYFAYHKHFIDGKMAWLNGEPTDNRPAAVAFLQRELGTRGLELAVTAIDKHNYPKYRDQILHLQSEVYEESRRSTGDEFDQLFQSTNPLGLAILKDRIVVGMAFAGQLGLFRDVSGVADDPHVDDPDVGYMLDLTVAPCHYGMLGRLLKRAMLLMAQTNGYTAMHGRNRDRLAAGMWAINLSLGSYCTSYLERDYPDQHAHRDCFYYRCPTVWQKPTVNLSTGIEQPLDVDQLDRPFVADQMPAMINKLTLSNFVTEPYLVHLEQVADIFPESLRHLYTANGLSEATDKIAKVLWKHRQPRNTLLTIEGSHFGSGSLLSRSLSGIGDPYFCVNRLPSPLATDDATYLAALETELQSESLMALFVEPFLRQSLTPLPQPILAQTIKLCHQYDVPIVFNDTVSTFYRYDRRGFSASSIDGLTPDASIVFLGGQMALAACSPKLFLDTPLLLISTWEGDAFSLAQFHRAMREVQADLPGYFATIDAYQARILDSIQATDLASPRLHNGVGHLHGKIPSTLAAHVQSSHQGRWTSCPSYGAMRRLLSESP